MFIHTVHSLVALSFVCLCLIHILVKVGLKTQTIPNLKIITAAVRWLFKHTCKKGRMFSLCSINIRRCFSSLLYVCLLYSSLHPPLTVLLHRIFYIPLLSVPPPPPSLSHHKCAWICDCYLCSRTHTETEQKHLTLMSRSKSWSWKETAVDVQVQHCFSQQLPLFYWFFLFFFCFTFITVILQSAQTHKPRALCVLVRECVCVCAHRF